MAGFCINCAAPLESGTKFCGACGAAADTTPPVSATKADRVPQVFSQAPGRRYPVLRIVAVILKVFAATTAVEHCCPALQSARFQALAGAVRAVG